MKTSEAILDYCFYNKDLIFTLPTQGIHLFSNLKLELNIFWCLNLGQRLNSGVTFLHKKPYAVDDKLRLIKWDSYFSQPNTIKHFKQPICCLASDNKSLFALHKDGKIYKIKEKGLEEIFFQKNESTVLFWQKSHEYLAFCSQQKNKFCCTIILFPNKKIEFTIVERPLNFWFSKEKRVVILMTKRKLQFYKYHNKIHRLISFELTQLVHGVVVNNGNTLLTVEKQESELLCILWSLNFFQRYLEKVLKINLKKPLQHLIRFSSNLLICESNIVHLINFPVNQLPTLVDVLTILKKNESNSLLQIDQLLKNGDKRILNRLSQLEYNGHWDKLFKFLNRCEDLNEFDAIILLNYSLEYEHKILSFWILKKNWTINFMKEALIFLKLLARFTELLFSSETLSLRKILWWSKYILEVRGFDMSNHNLLIFQNFIDKTLENLENILKFRQNVKITLHPNKKQRLNLYKLETIII